MSVIKICGLLREFFSVCFPPQGLLDLTKNVCY